jgi:hypothetical protein
MGDSQASADNLDGQLGEDEDYENVAVEKMDSWFIFAHVYDKVVNISCGDASQRIKWLAHVAIGKCVWSFVVINIRWFISFSFSARWDEIQYQGWKRLGIPTSVRLNHKDGEELDMNANIRDILRSGDHVHIETSIPPSLVK